MEEPPHPMRLGDSERDYYLGAGLRPAATNEDGSVDAGATAAEPAGAAP
jgi:hypothetical protein